MIIFAILHFTCLVWSYSHFNHFKILIVKYFKLFCGMMCICAALLVCNNDILEDFQKEGHKLDADEDDIMNMKLFMRNYYDICK